MEEHANSIHSDTLCLDTRYSYLRHSDTLCLDTRYNYLGPKWPQSQHQSIFLRALSAKHAGIDYSIYLCRYIHIHIHIYIYIRRPRLQQGERVRGGITSSKGQDVITSSKGKKQENKKEEARSKKQLQATSGKKQEISNVRQWGPWPAGPVRPSGPCCLAVAQAPFWVRQL